MKIIAFIFIAASLIILGVNLWEVDFQDLNSETNLGLLVGIISAVCLGLLGLFMLVIQKYQSQKK